MYSSPEHLPKQFSGAPAIILYENFVESSGIIDESAVDDKISVRNVNGQISYSHGDIDRFIVGDEAIETYIKACLEQIDEHPADTPLLTCAIAAVQAGIDYTDIFDDDGKQRLLDDLWHTVEMHLSPERTEDSETTADLMYSVQSSELSDHLDRYIGKIVADAESLSSLTNCSIVRVYLSDKRRNTANACDDMRYLNDLAARYLEKCAK